MAISHEAPYEETGLFSENPSSESSTEHYRFKVVSYLKMRGKEPTGGMCIRPSALSHYSRRVQPFPDYIQATEPQIQWLEPELDRVKLPDKQDGCSISPSLQEPSSQWTKWQPLCSHACVFRAKVTGVTLARHFDILLLQIGIQHDFTNLLSFLCSKGYCLAHPISGLSWIIYRIYY